MKKFLKEIRRINWRQTFFGSLRRKVVTFVLIIPLLVYGASVGYQYYLQLNPAVVYAHKLQTMTQTINQSVALPKDETPVVATVTDQNQLPKQTFFSFARNGDKILMYKKHKLAVLFRPSTNAVVTKATLDFQDVTPTPAGGSAQAVAGASTSAIPAQVVGVTAVPVTDIPATPGPTMVYHPQGKVLVQPQ